MVVSGLPAMVIVTLAALVFVTMIFATPVIT